MRTRVGVGQQGGEVTFGSSREMLDWMQANRPELVPSVLSELGATGGSQGTDPVNSLYAQTSGHGGYTQGNRDITIPDFYDTIQGGDGSVLVWNKKTGEVVRQVSGPSKGYEQSSQLQSQKAQSERELAMLKHQQEMELKGLDRDPATRMAPKWTAPSINQGLRGAVDYFDPNTGSWIPIRQPEPPEVRIAGGNLIVPPGASAAVHYGGSSAPVMASGGPLPPNMPVQLPGAQNAYGGGMGGGMGSQMPGARQSSGAAGSYGIPEGNPAAPPMSASWGGRSEESWVDPTPSDYLGMESVRSSFGYPGISQTRLSPPVSDQYGGMFVNPLEVIPEPEEEDEWGLPRTVHPWQRRWR